MDIFKTIISYMMIIAFVFTNVAPSYAQVLITTLPAPGVPVALSQAISAPLLAGLKVYPNEPFKLDFILDTGDAAGVTSKNESRHLIKYFLAALTTPEDDLWVNLSPYEKDRIVPEAFGQTDMGRDLLAQDYLLKQVASSLLHPEGEIGKIFWDKVYAKSQALYGTIDIPLDTFNKIWIVPQKAVVFENAQSEAAFIVESRLKVMLESDYVALENAVVDVGAKTASSETQELVEEMMREVVLPEVEIEVNQGANFVALRQVYHSLILASWYKKKIKESLLSQVYVDQKKVDGIVIEDDLKAQKIWEQYVQAFKQGVFNYIGEEEDALTGEIVPRKYFSGGANFDGKQLDAAMRVSSDRSLLNKAGVLTRLMVISVSMSLATSSLAATFESQERVSGTRLMATVETGDTARKLVEEAILKTGHQITLEQVEALARELGDVVSGSQIDLTRMVKKISTLDVLNRVTPVRTISMTIHGRPLTVYIVDESEDNFKHTAYFNGDQDMFINLREIQQKQFSLRKGAQVDLVKDQLAGHIFHNMSSGEKFEWFLRETLFHEFAHARYSAVDDPLPENKMMRMQDIFTSYGLHLSPHEVYMASAEMNGMLAQLASNGDPTWLYDMLKFAWRTDVPEDQQPYHQASFYIVEQMALLLGFEGFTQDGAIPNAEEEFIKVLERTSPKQIRRAARRLFKETFGNFNEIENVVEGVVNEIRKNNLVPSNNVQEENDSAMITPAIVNNSEVAYYVPDVSNPRLLGQAKEILGDLQAHLNMDLNQEQSRNTIFGKNNEDVAKRLVELASILRLDYPYNAKDNRQDIESLNPLSQAIRQKSFFKIGQNLYISPSATESFRRHSIFKTDENGRVIFSYEFMVPGEMRGKQESDSEKRKRIAEEINSNFPGQEYSVSIPVVTSFSYTGELYDGIVLSGKDIEVGVYDVGYQGRRLTNVTQEQKESLADEMNIGLDDLEKRITRGVIECFLAVKTSGYLGRMDIHLENFRLGLVYDKDGHVKDVKVQLVGDFEDLRSRNSKLHIAFKIAGLAALIASFYSDDFQLLAYPDMGKLAAAAFFGFFWDISDYITVFMAPVGYASLNKLVSLSPLQIAKEYVEASRSLLRQLRGRENRADYIFSSFKASLLALGMSLPRVIADDSAGGIVFSGKAKGVGAVGVDLSQADAAEKVGGIDLTFNRLDVQTRGNGEILEFTIDPQMLKELRNASGFTPVVTNIQPLESLLAFLGF